MTALCKGCDKRYLGCHGKCEAYLLFYQARRAENALDGHEMEGKLRVIRRRRKRG